MLPAHLVIPSEKDRMLIMLLLCYVCVLAVYGPLGHCIWGLLHWALCSIYNYFSCWELCLITCRIIKIYQIWQVYSHHCCEQKSFGEIILCTANGYDTKFRQRKVFCVLPESCYQKKMNWLVGKMLSTDIWQ